jgi:endonuclease/exonuclease/phosphatase family metal-dependent hydrolase
MIKVASYNIRKAIGTDRRRDPERILDLLCHLDADIVALQEADRRFGPRHAVLPPRLLESHSPYRAVPLAAAADGMGWHGNALLVRRGAQIVEHERLLLPHLEPRGAVMAALRVDAGAVRVIGMHLDLSGLWRRRQAGAVLHAADRANAARPLPTILMGDLNEWTRQGGCLRDFGRHYAFAPCGRSFHAMRPVAPLDRIMYAGGLDLVDCGACDHPLARRASDHLPIWARFEVSAALTNT